MTAYGHIDKMRKNVFDGLSKSQMDSRFPFCAHNTNNKKETIVPEAHVITTSACKRPGMSQLLSLPSPSPSKHGITVKT